MKPKTEHRKQIEKERCEELKRNFDHYIYCKENKELKVVSKNAPPFIYIKYIQE